MGWSIRNQILVPFALILLTAVTTIAVFAAVLATRRSERQTLTHLDQLCATLGQSNFPYAPNVLEKLRGLSGAHFVVTNRDGGYATTLVLSPLEINLLSDVPTMEPHLSLDEYPTFSVQGVRYFAAAVRRVPPDGTKLFVLYPEQSWQQARWEAALPPLSVGVATILLTGIVSAWLAHRFASRIRSVQQQARRIAAGEFKELRAAGPRDEIRDLIASFNVMSSQLKQMREAVRQSERARLLGQLAGGIAHQLRNSVTGARLAVQIHARRCPLQHEDQSLEIALHQLELTEEQVKGFLALGKKEPRPFHTCNVGKVIEDVRTLVGPACEHARVSITTELAAELPTLQADASSLRTAVLNLTLNAIEAAGPDGHVRLSGSFHADAIRIEVVDSGKGPNPDVENALFDPFVTDKAEGVGLGLTLAKQVAEDHGGTLTWERAAGETRFRVLLPVSKSASEPPARTH